MAKDTFYFSHDYNARNDPKILELRSEFGLEGYGIYWCLIETMAEDEKGVIMASLMGGLSVGYGVAKDRLLKIVDFMVNIGLLYRENDTIYSQRMMEHKMFRKALSDKGKEGAEKRWKNGIPNGGANGIPNAKERKEKERKEKENKVNKEEALVFPFSSKEFINLWQSWKDYKKLQHRFTYKCVKTEQAALMQLGRLAGGDEPTGMKIIEQSIANGWQGLFELKNQNNGKLRFNHNRNGNSRITEADRNRIAADLHAAVNKGTDRQD